MENDLIVITFGDEAAALKAKEALEQMRFSPFIGLLNAIVVTRDKAGKVVVHQQWELPRQRPNAQKQVPRLLVEALFGHPPEEGAQKLVDAGLDETFVQGVVTALGPRSSMILSYISKDSLVDTRQVLDALSQFRGTLHRTTVPAEVEEAILKQAEHE